MTKMEIIKSVSESKEWMNSLVIGEKPNGSLRIYLDQRNFNKVIQREHFQVPSTEEIFADIQGAKFFSINLMLAMDSGRSQSMRTAKNS